MPAPKQVQAQVEAVNAHYADPVDPNADPKAAPVVDPAPVAAPVADVPKEPAAPSTTNEPVVVTQDETFEQKYRTLQGMFNAQVPRLTAENRELNTQVQNAEARLRNLEGLIASMQQGQPRTAPGGAAPAAPQSRLTDAEREEYGESIEVMRKVSHDVVAPYETEIRRLQGEVQRLSGATTQVARDTQQAVHRVAQTAEQQFWAGLDRLFPNWHEVNDDPDFQTWLLERDPLSGFTRQRFLEEAQQNLDHSRVSSFFVAWANKQNGAGKQAQPSGAAPQTELERQVAPGRGRSGGAPTGDARKTYTKDDITKFFADVRTGAYKGREAERDRVESDIFAAQRDGRIVQ